MEEVNSSQIFEDEQSNVIEVTLKEFDEMVALKKSLDRLNSNPDFISVIREGYLEADAIRLLGFLKGRNVQALKDRDVIVEKIAAKGILEYYLKELNANLTGIDNPEQRLELERQLAEKFPESVATEEALNGN